MPALWKRCMAQALVLCLIHNPVFVRYIGTGFLTVFPAAVLADAFTDRAAEGQSLGSSLRNGFAVPLVDATTGRLTLQNGAAAGQTIEQGALFPQIVPGSMDGAYSAYGNSDAMGAFTQTVTGGLANDGSTQYGQAYQTMLGANTAGADIYNDPIWSTSDAILSRSSPLIDQLFTGCSTTTTRTAGTATAHIPDYETCDKYERPPTCQVTRQIQAVGPPVIQTGGSGSLVENSQTQMTLFLGTGLDGLGSGCPAGAFSMTVDVTAPDRISAVKLVGAGADDNINFLIDGVSVFNSGGCSDRDPWAGSYSIDLTSRFRTAGTHMLQLYVYTGGGTHNGGGYVSLRITKSPNIQESFTDNPPGCRARVFDNWPPSGTVPGWVSSGSVTDAASTPYWQCTDAAYSRIIDGVTIDSTTYGPYVVPILPDPPAAPPAPICYGATTRQPDSGTMACWTDTSGYQHCPTVSTDSANSCSTLAGNPSCAYVKEECVNGATDFVTGQCYAWTVTYDCGYDQSVPGSVAATANTICDAQLRCMGTECLAQAVESNPDFGKAAAALEMLNTMQMDADCKSDPGNCRIFEGKPYECKKAMGGIVDCCQKPNGVSFVDYIDLAFNTWAVAEELGVIGQFTNSGAWRAIADGTAASWSAVTEPFTTALESVGWTDGAESVVSTISPAALQQGLMNSVGQWVFDTFGETAFTSIFSGTISTTVGGATSVSVAGLAGIVGSMLSFVMMAYAIYQIVMLLIQIIWACEQDEFELGAKREMRVCHKVGSYCASDVLGLCIEKRDAYCCFNSAFSRIMQEQLRPQLGMAWGEPENPNCSALTISQLAGADMSHVDLSEWVGMLTVANKLPASYADAATRYTMENLTTGHLPGTQVNDAGTINQTIFEQVDIEATRRQVRGGM